MTAEQRFQTALTLEEAAAEQMRRNRCRASLVGFAQNIDIPTVPVSPVDRDVRSDERPDDDFDGAIIQEHLLAPIGLGISTLHMFLMHKLQECMETRYGKLMIFMPPGAAKSTYGSVLAPTWCMGKYPGTQIILGSYNTALAKKHGSRGRNIVSQDMFMGAFGTTIDSGTQAKELWALTNGSEYMSGGLQSGLTGNRADGLIIDDPVRGRADAKSETVQVKTIDAYEEDAQTRLKPGAWQILIQTRWDINDLAGFILPRDYAGESGLIMCRDGMEWEIINLPAKAIHDDDPLGRKKGEYIWPEWFDQKHWYQYEPRPGDPNSPNQRRWDSLYQQMPMPESGNQWDKDFTQWYEPGEEPEYLVKFCASDYAVTSDKDADDPDYTEHGIGGLDENGHLWITDWYYGRYTTNYTINALIKMCKENHVRSGFGEQGIIRRAIESQFEQQQREHGYWLDIEYLPHIGDKVAKFADIRAMGAAGRVHLPNTPWGHRVHKQMTVFPSPGEKDDAVDVMALFGRAAKNMKWSRKNVTKAKSKGIEFGSWEWLTYNEAPVQTSKWK